MVAYRTQPPTPTPTSWPPPAQARGGHIHGGLAGGEWAKGLNPSRTLIHIDMTEPERAGALRKKGQTIDLWQKLQLALPELRAVPLIPAPKTIDSRFGVVSMYGSGKLKSGFHRIYPTTNLVHCPVRMDMIALNE